MSFIDELRKKPDHVKGKVAFAMAVSTVGIIGLVWVTALPARFAETDIETAPADVINGKVPPVEESASIGEAFSNIKQNLGAFVGQFKSSPTEPVVEEENGSNAPEDDSDAQLVVEEETTVGQKEATTTPSMEAENSYEGRTILISTSTKKSEPSY